MFQNSMGLLSSLQGELYLYVTSIRMPIKFIPLSKLAPAVITLDLCVVGAWFESQPTEAYMVFLSPSRVVPQIRP